MPTLQYRFKLEQLMVIFGAIAAASSTNIGLSFTLPAFADDQLFPDPPAAVAPLSSPLSGSVRVIDQVRKAPMRLKRANVDGASSTPFSAETSFPSTSSSSSDSGASGSSKALPTHSGSVTSSGSDSGLQALFPSTDSFNPPPALNGAVSADAKAKKKHVYIWNMSLAGGYYDVTNTFQGVVPGNKLYLYGGFMADGHTPVPTGPVPMNEGGHIRWTPIMGSPPDDD